MTVTMKKTKSVGITYYKVYVDDEYIGFDFTEDGGRELAKTAERMGWVKHD